MPLPNRYDINQYLTPEILNAYPAWLMAYDEEGLEGQDEATIKPNDLGDSALPGYVVVDVTFADGTSGLGLAGGDFGVEALKDLDDLRLYDRGVVWTFSLSPGRCELDWPEEPFFERYASLLPMRIKPRLVEAFGGNQAQYGFTISAAGSLHEDGAG